VARHLVPAQDAIVGYIAPIETARIAEIDWSFRPPHPGGQPFDAREQEPIFVEARIEDLDRRIRIALARLPGCERFGCDRSERSGSTDGCDGITSRIHWPSSLLGIRLARASLMRSAELAASLGAPRMPNCTAGPSPACCPRAASDAAALPSSVMNW